MPSFGGPEQVLKYLAQYTHRLAISNRRLVALKDGRVVFRYKDYARGGKRRTLELTATEFLRRFLLHLLPPGFVRVRHYGFLANRHRVEKVTLCRELLAAAAPPQAESPGAPTPSAPAEPVVVTKARCGTTCPACGVGQMVIIEWLPPATGVRNHGPRPVARTPFDTS